MAKQGGLGDNFYVGGFDISLDVSSIDQMSGPLNTIAATGIKQFANARLPGLRDADWQITSYMDITVGTPPYWVDNLHTLPRTDVVAQYFKSNAAGAQALGNASAAITGLQIDYAGTRDNTGNLTFKTEIMGDGFGYEWGEALTPGLRTDTTATIGPVQDDGASSAFGGQAYYQLMAFTGTSVTIDIQSSTTSGGTYATTGLTSPALSAAPAFGRLKIANNVTINEFVKVITTGTFTNAVFAVTFCRNKIAGVVF